MLANTPRTLDNMQYYQLLHPTISAPTTPIDDRQVNGFIEALFGGMYSNITADVLATWTEDLDGYCDLLSTLNVIFGKRTGLSSVSTR